MMDYVNRTRSKSQRPFMNVTGGLNMVTQAFIMRAVGENVYITDKSKKYKLAF